MEFGHDLWCITYGKFTNSLVFYLCFECNYNWYASDCDFLPIQLNHGDDNLVVLLITFVEVIYAFGLMFLACELCQRTTLAFEECSDTINQFDWYLLPADIQRMLPMIIQFDQQPVQIKCFGTVASDRETFKFVSFISFLRL